MLAVFALTFNADFDFGSSLPRSAESTSALDEVHEHCRRGRQRPEHVILHSTDGDAARARTSSRRSRPTSRARTASPGRSPAPASDDGTVAAISVLLDDDPASDAAIADVKGPIRPARTTAAPDGTEAFVGGTTAVFVDFQDGDEPRLLGGLPGGRA